MDQSLKKFRIEHLKGRGDGALRQGNNKTAYTRYTEALDLQPERDVAKRLLSNRSLAYDRAHKYPEALADAEKAIQLAPGWEKAHYRKGSALLSLKAYPEAALAFRNAWQLDQDNAEISAKMRRAVHAMTRQQVASGLLQILSNLESRGVLLPAKSEAASSAELAEAAFCIIKAAQLDLPRAKPYHDQYMRWLREGPCVGEAMTQRAAIYAAAKCFLQARSDARSAVEWYNTNSRHESEKSRVATACAYLRLGQALLAEPKHADQDAFAAAKAFAKGLDLDGMNPELQEGSKAARELLSLEQLHQVQAELRSEGCQSFGEESAAVDFTLTLGFPLATAKHLSGAARIQLSALLGHRLAVEAKRLVIACVRQAHPGLEVVLAGTCEHSAEEMHGRLSAMKEEALGSEMEELLGPGNILEAEIITKSNGRSKSEAAPEPNPQLSTSKDLFTVPRPKSEIALPYKSYSLVNTDGVVVERIDKHPFCMSRVYYNKEERPPEVWAEDAEHTYRWRQTGGEIKLIALKVPPEMRPKHLAVTMEAFHVRVANKLSGEVYLEGRLERGIVPQECVWTHGGGSGEDGCLLLLQKMNLELLQRHWLHSEMWWPRLFKGGPEIAWDDYEKDYSDLPAAILAEHEAVEAEQEVQRSLDASERREKELSKEREEASRRRKLEDLKAKKPASFEEWTQLQLDIAAHS